MTVDRTKSHEAALALLWGEPRKRTRGPKPAHSLEDILDKAIGIADREGLRAVSMQRLADEMMFTKMAVYRYVPGRTELLALMTDRALGPPPTISPGRWRDRIEAWALAVFTVFLKHPWGLQTTTGDRVIGPNEARWTEVALGILAETGLDGGDRLDILAVTAGHMRSIAQHAAAWGGLEKLEREMQDMFGLMLRGREEKFPELTKSIAESRNSANENNGLTFGLNCIFDGVEARVARTIQRRTTRGQSKLNR
jgi:AcrR family transcriptional regulator